MANFIKLHDFETGNPILINMETIEFIQDEVTYTEIMGIKHWSSHKVRERVDEIIEKMESKGE